MARARACHSACMESEDNLQEVALPIYHAGPGHAIQAGRLGSIC